jgi:hypothetical protein
MLGPSDRELERRIANAQKELQAWAQLHDLWYDSGFTTYAQRVDGEPGESAVVFILYSSGDLARLLDEDSVPELREQFDRIAETCGFYYSNEDGYSYYFYATTDELQAEYDQLFHWKWVCSLIIDDFGDVYAELYQHFHARPDRLRQLHHRQFEILLHRIFQGLGYQSAVGPGVGDGGVDVRLLQRGPLGDTLALVQAKKYALNRPIGLEAVAALRGVVANDSADRGIFVTTSRYLPSAEVFAHRSAGVLELRTSDDVAQWCQQAQEGVIQDKSSLVSDAHLNSVLRDIEHGDYSRILHASTGFRTMGNAFAIVLKETRHAALLMTIPKQIVSQDSYGLEGHEAPVLGSGILSWRTSDTVFRAKRKIDEEGRVSFWDGSSFYTRWDRQPCFSSHLD